MSDVFLGSVYAKLELRDDNLGRQIASAKRSLASIDDGGSFHNITRNINSTKSALMDFSKSVASVSWNLFKDGAAAAATTVGALATKGVKAGSQLEDIRTQLIGLTHSTQEANKAMATTVEFFQNNPFQRGDVAEATKQLTLYGVKNKDLMSTLKKVGSVALTTGSNIGDLARVYGRASSQSKVMVGDLDELAMRAPGIWEAIAKQVGKSAGEVRESIKGAGLDVKIFQKAFESLYDATASAEFEKTLSRQVDRFKGATQKIAAAMGGYAVDAERGIVANEQGIMRSVTRFLKAVADETTSASSNWPKLVASLTRLGEAISPVLDKITAQVPSAFQLATKAIDFFGKHSKALLPVLGGAAIAFGGLAKDIPVVGSIINGVSGSVGGLAKNFLKLARVNPIVAGLVVLFTVGFVKAYKENENFRKSISDLFSAFMNLGRAVAPVLNTMVKSFAKLAGSKAMVTVLTAMAKALTAVVNAIASLPEPVLTGIITALMGFATVGKAIAPLKELGGVLGGLTKGITGLGGGKVNSGIGEAIAGILRPLGDTAVLKGAGSVVLVGAGLVLIAKSIGEATKINYDVGKLTAFAGCVTVVGVIMGLVGKFGKYTTIGGIATAVIGVGLVSVAKGLQEASTSAELIDPKSLNKFYKNLIVVEIVMALIGTFGKYSAIGGIATAIVGGGLAVTAKCLVEASKDSQNIKMENLVNLEKDIAVVSAILAAIAGFAIFGSVGSVASAVLSGGLVLTSMALKRAADEAKNLDDNNLNKLNSAVFKTSTILGLIAGLAVFGAVGSIATTILGGGLVLTSMALNKAADSAKGIDPNSLDKLNASIIKVDAILAAMAGLAVFGAVGSILTAVITDGVLKAAKGLQEASAYAKNLSSDAMDAMGNMLKKIASWGAGDILSNLLNLISTAILTKTAQNVSSVVTTLSGVRAIPNDAIDSLGNNMKKLAELNTGGILDSIGKMWSSGNLKTTVDNVKSIITSLSSLPNLPSTGTIDNLKAAIYSLSQIKIQGSGFFENKGAAASELAFVIWKIKDMGNNLAGIPDVDKSKADRLVDSIKTFDRIDENARAGVMRLNSMGDSLGNINWIKHILGDIPGDIAAKTGQLVDAIKKFDGISIDGGKLKSVAEAMGNLVNSIKTQIGGLTQIMTQAGSSSAGGFINGIMTKFGEVGAQGQAMGNKFKDGLMSVNPAMVSAGTGAQGQYWRGIQSKMNDEYWQGRALGGKVNEGLRAVDMRGAGINAVQGFINGANSRNPYSTGWNIANKFLQGLKARGQQGSPWKTTFQSGVWAGEGFADGITRSESLVERAASSIADVATSAMKIDNMKEMMVTPDMRQINALSAQFTPKVERNKVERANETNIYGTINITPNGDSETVFEELNRATMLASRGMATGV